MSAITRDDLDEFANNADRIATALEAIAKTLEYIEAELDSRAGDRRQAAESTFVLLQRREREASDRLQRANDRIDDKADRDILQVSASDWKESDDAFAAWKEAEDELERFAAAHPWLDEREEPLTDDELVEILSGHTSRRSEA